MLQVIRKYVILAFLFATSSSLFHVDHEEPTLHSLMQFTEHISLSLVTYSDISGKPWHCISADPQ